VPADREKEQQMRVADIVRAMEALAPPELAEDWDNVGLLVGDLDIGVRKLMVCTDVTEAVLAEAVRVRAQMLIAHHPVIFQNIQRVTACETPVVYEAVRRGLAIYAAHTNFDAAPGGTNDVLADILQLVDRRPLAPTARGGQCKVVVFVPPDDLPRVADAAFAAGAGRIGRYRDCAFFCHGIGSFYGMDGTRPAVGDAGRHEVIEELRLEMVCSPSRVSAVCEAIQAAHSYEEPAIDTYMLRDFPTGCGAGRIGKLRRPVTVQTLIGRLKKAVGVRRLLIAAAAGDRNGDRRGMLVTTAACFSGSGGAAFREAVAQGANFYVTGEMSHHHALEAVAAGTTVVCLGHGHSEHLAVASLAKRLPGQLAKVKVVVSEQDRDPFAIA